MSRPIVKFGLVLATLGALGATGGGCLDRPIVANNPTTKTNFTTSVQQNAIDKVDLLFDIDNSASMGDKQAFLAAAVPDLINRLVTPNCLDNMTQKVVGQSNAGACPMGSTIEFPPVHNMHIGIISSSLGTRGIDPTAPGAVCVPTSNTGMFLDGTAALATHNDDRAELLNRTPGSGSSCGANCNIETESTSAATGGQGFLDWFPTGTGWAENNGKMADPGGVLTPPATPISLAATLNQDFAALVIGTHTFGCGIESQLESWYRFLVQPDPYDSIAIQSNAAVWVNVDKTIIQQRHDFLRPDSLVAIIDLTDENDSEIDVRSFGGQGYKFMDQTFQPPRGTSQCTTSPPAAGCTSCAYCSGGNPASICNDPQCKMGPYSATTDWGFYINVRHVHMFQKYGIQPQYPLARYVLGLTSPVVPDRFHEYPSGATSYQGGTVYSGTPPTLQDASDLNCTNPLFAKTLPDGSDLTPQALCNQSGAGGPRTPDLIFYAHIGGVPHQLLQTSPGDATGLCPTGTNPADCPQKDTLLPTDWVNILGQGWESPPQLAPNPGAYDYTNINPLMIEDYKPRTYASPDVTAPVAPAATGGSATGTSGKCGTITTASCSGINGGEWVTDTASPQHTLPVDREYACIFPLVDPMTGTPTPRDCSMANSGTDPLNFYACDCGTTGLPTTPGSAAVPTVCGQGSGGDYTTQYYAKTYPTIREIQLVELMGKQGILSSLCPIHTTFAGGDMSDPLFGYRPAVNSIVNRLKNALATQCLPQQLSADSAGSVPCLVLATLTNQPASAESTACNNAAAGLSVPDSSILKTFQASQHANFLNGQTSQDLSTFATCEVAQIPYVPDVSCATSGGTGWCYATGKAAGACPQAILFTPGVPPTGSIVSLQCIEGLAAASDGGGGG